MRTKMNEIRNVSYREIKLDFVYHPWKVSDWNWAKTKAVRIHNFDPSKFDRSQVSFGRDADLESIYSDIDDRKNDENQNQNTFYNRGRLNASNNRFPSKSNSTISSFKDRV